MENYSFGRFINVRNVDTRFYTRNNCMFYIIITPRPITANISVYANSSVIIGYKNESLRVPNLLMNLSDYIVPKYVFISGGISYIFREYKALSSNYTSS